MATIKAGVYRFRDIVIWYSTMETIVRQPIKFKCAGQNFVGISYTKTYINYIKSFDIFDWVEVYIEHSELEYQGFWATNAQTIEVTEDADVSDEFYAWFICNTKPSVSIVYDSKELVSLTPNHNATLKCSTKRMKDNIVVKSPQIVLHVKTATDNGFIYPDEGYDGLRFVRVSVPSFDGNWRVN